MRTSDAFAIAAWMLVPLASFLVSKRRVAVHERWKCAQRGITMGTLALPLSMIVLALFSLSPLAGIISVLPGIILLKWHLLPFGGAFDRLYFVAIGLGPTTGAFSLLAPTLFWALAYGSVGAIVDVRRRHALAPHKLPYNIQLQLTKEPPSKK